jgi:CheY-like chemotaxis protein
MDYIRIARALLHVSPDRLAAQMGAGHDGEGVKWVAPAPLMLGHEGLAAGLKAVIAWYRAELPAEAPAETTSKAAHPAPAEAASVQTYLALRSRWEERQAKDIVAQMSERARRQAKVATAAADPVTRRRALLVDDASDVVVTVSAFLESFGFEVTRASSGDAALTMLADGCVFDLLVTDHAMPGMTGKDLAVQACQMHKSMRALIITGFPDARDLSMLPEGIMLLAKPFRRAELADCIRLLFASNEAKVAVSSSVE